jgi:glutaredoxin 3
MRARRRLFTVLVSALVSGIGVLMAVSFRAAPNSASPEPSAGRLVSETLEAGLEPVDPQAAAYSPAPEPHALVPASPNPEPMVYAPSLPAREARDRGEASAAPDARIEPTQADVDRALRSTPVVMYSTQWCPVCRKARQYLVRNGISVRELDIESNRAAREELVQRTGQTGVPTIEIDGVLLAAGFNQDRVLRALVASVEQRLGIQGLEPRRVE